LAAAVCLTVPVAADERDNKSLDWLMQEPVTLLDLGIYRLKEDLARVARRFHQRGFTALLPETGAFYDGREKRVIAYMAVRETLFAPNHQTCRQAFGRMARSLVGKGPVGNNQAGWYLENIFAPEGPGNAFRPKTMASDLLESVRFEISILPPDPLKNSSMTRCAGRLDADLNDLDYSIS